MMDEEPSVMFDFEVKKADIKRVVLLSDIHGNLTALNAVLDDMKTRDYDAVLCLGDLIGYYTKPVEVIKLIKKLSRITVMGNHDWVGADLNNPLFKITRPAAQESLKFTNPLINKTNRKWLLSLPLKVILETPYATATLVHGHPKTIFDYVYGSTKKLFDQEIELALTDTQTDYLFVGHSHIQGEYFSPSGKIFVNPGAIGQPRDNDIRAAYAIVDFEKRKNELLRVKYDVQEVINDISKCCLPEELGERLRFGI